MRPWYRPRRRDRLLGNGAFDVTALFGRLNGARTPAAALAVFDLLADAGRDLRGQPYLARWQRLHEVLDGCQLPLLLVPHTRDRHAVLAWLTEHAAAGIEGVVAKRTDQHYNVTRNACGRSGPACPTRP